MGKFDPLRDVGNEYMADSLAPEELPDQKYTKYDIPIGRIKRTGKIYYINARDATRSIIFGMAGSGKTFFMRGWGDRVFRSGFNLFYAIDVKDEFKSSNFPVQTKFASMLLPDERPEATPIVVLRPTFFKRLSDGGLPSGNRWFSVSFEKLTQSDFMTLLNSSELTLPQKNVLEEALDELKNKGETITIEDLKLEVESSDSSSATQRSLVMAFRLLGKSHFYVKEYEVNPIALLRQNGVPDEEDNGKAIALNMEGFDNLQGGRFLFPETVVSATLRMVINARRAKKIKPIWVFVDEASRFVPADRELSSKHLIMESVDLDRRYNVSYVFAVQEITKIPEAIVKQCQYIFVPYSADVGTISHVLKMAGLIRNALTQTTDAIRVKNTMRKFDWLVIDRVAGTKEVITPLAPLSRHAETTE